MASPQGSPLGLVRRPSKRFGRGYTALVDEEHHTLPKLRQLMDFGVLRQGTNQRHATLTEKETIWVLLHGQADVGWAGKSQEVSRRSLFDEAPTVVHAGPGETVELISRSADTEWAVIAASGSQYRGVKLHRPDSVANEDRGAGLVQDACRRTVRTVFDYTAEPLSQLVVGEVVNRAGRWSSYPPHHHAQPELYHYRFTAPQGYGHAELGESVVKVRDGDTTLIPGGLDHAQVSAPGYGMYYLWVVRHLPRRPYRGFQFSKEHTWLLDPKNQGWQPSP